MTDTLNSTTRTVTVPRHRFSIRLAMYKSGLSHITGATLIKSTGLTRRYDIIGIPRDDDLWTVEDFRNVSDL